jgi:hypothetical protein
VDVSILPSPFVNVVDFFVLPLTNGVVSLGIELIAVVAVITVAADSGFP